MPLRVLLLTASFALVEKFEAFALSSSARRGVEAWLMLSSARQAQLNEAVKYYDIMINKKGGRRGEYK